MSFNVKFNAQSKGEALSEVEHQSLPQGVAAFIKQAIHGFSEPGGQFEKGAPMKPVAIRVEATGHLDDKGGDSTCTIKVSKGEVEEPQVDRRA